jgi:hypothetical protein
MLFAYNSSPAMGAAAIKLDDHAKSLLQWLWLKRKASKLSYPPLIRDFVLMRHYLGCRETAACVYLPLSGRIGRLIS